MKPYYRYPNWPAVAVAAACIIFYALYGALQ